MSHSRLFSPIAVGSLQVRNRLWMPPMCQYSAADSGEMLGRPTAWHEHHYAVRALGGVGAAIVEATGVTPEGRISVNCLSLHNDDQIPAFLRLSTAIHDGGAAAFIQLNHAGRKGSTRAGWLEEGTVKQQENGWQTVAPSPIAVSERFDLPRAMEEAEIQQVIQDFASAAQRAIQAGFDGVQIHGAHGYLIQEFMSPATNKRDDCWGGDFDGRVRLLREIVKATRTAIGSAPLLVRISATDWTQEYVEDGRPGWTLEETMRLMPLLAQDGVDMVNVSTGGNIPDAHVGRGPGYQVFAARAAREVLNRNSLSQQIPISTAGLILAPEQAEQILADNSADVVEVGRPLLTDPMLPQVWRARLREESTLPPQYWRGTRR